MKKGYSWVFVRYGQVEGVFSNRKEAVRYFKEMLKQTLKDFDKQDKTDEYNYSITIPEMKFLPIKLRDASLSL